MADSHDDLGEIRYDTVEFGAARGFGRERQEWAIFVVMEFEDGTRQSIPFTIEGAETLVTKLQGEITAAKGASPN